MYQYKGDKKNEIMFHVKGSAKEPYEVIFVKRSDNNLSAYCDCPAGSFGTYCKHRFNILDGKLKDIVSDNLNDIDLVQSWFIGSDIEAAMENVKQCEKEMQKAKRVLVKVKKRISKSHA